MKMRSVRRLLWIAVVALAMVGAFPRGAAAGCGQRCVAISPTCSRCGLGATTIDGCVALSTCSCVNVTCDPGAAEKATADSALSLLLLTPEDAQTGGRCTLQEPAALGG